MTDKVQKIRKELERLKEWQPIASPSLNKLLSFIDSLQEEPVSKDFEMALAEMIDKAQTSVVEPLVIAAQWKDELIELVKSEEPVNEKKCMFTKDIYTDEYRKVLCEDCKERCEYSKKEEPVSEDLEKAAVEAFKKIVDSDKNSFLEIFKAGAEWQREQMTSKE